jgi:hypothetical protein
MVEMIGFSRERKKRKHQIDILAFEEVVPPGIEPGTQGFSVLCSTN